MKKWIIFYLVLLGYGSVAKGQNILNTYKLTDLYEDYDLLVNALKEAHPGLYWYTSRPDFEKIFSTNRTNLRDGMNTYDFYRIASRVLSADREGHSSVAASKDIAQFVAQKGKYLPFAVKTLGGKLFITNNIGGNDTRGKIITHINSTPIDTIIAKIFDHSSRYSDGFSVTGKYKDLDHFGFSGLYMDIIDYATDRAVLTIQNPEKAGSKEISIDLINRDSLIQISKTVSRPTRKHEDQLFYLEKDFNGKTSILTFNTFDYSRFKKKGQDFEVMVDSIFKQIKASKTQNLIIDVREVGGGNEGAEDYIFSYLTSKHYEKYKYVEANGFTYGFLQGKGYEPQKESLEAMLKDEHELTKDGRVLRRKSVLQTVKPQKRPYKGNIFILCSGKTYSGGSEFVSIAKAYSKAVIVGEETGGGFYGQTSGSYAQLLLPHSQLKIRIPLLKFATTFESDKIPFGRGVIPDYIVLPTFEEFSKGIDSELAYTLKLIAEKF